MKLIRFKVNTPEGFRSLQNGFEIYFLRDFDYQLAHNFNPNILAGRNGSGKSNVLEALANIFYHLDCMFNDYLPDGFLQDDENPTGFDNRSCVIDAFELEYFMDIPIELMDKAINELPEIPINQIKAKISITKKVGQIPVFKWLNRNEYSNKIELLGKKEIQLLLPKYILGYSSGENELLSLPFFKTRFLHFDEYADKLTHEEPFGFPPKSEGRLVYLDKDYSQAILLCNLLMQDKKMLIPFNEEVELEDLDEFRLIICLDKYLDLHNDILRDRKLISDEIYSRRNNQILLTHNLRDSIEILKKCATSFEIQSNEELFSEDKREYLILDYKVTQATKDAFGFYFTKDGKKDPLQLFQLFQILLELNAYVVSDEDKKRVYQSKNIFINHDIYPNPLEEDRIIRFKNLWIKKKGLSKPLFTKELSDGEHQFLHALGLSLLFKNESCLFLLDEPETHFNPNWKAKFISSIRNCFAIEESANMREMLITTHSPYLVSDSESKYVHVFVKDDETKEVTCSFPEFQTLGTSVNKITLRIFNKPDTIGTYANDKIEKLRKEFDESTDKQVFLCKVRKEIGESVESMLFINEIIDQIESK
ncbi:restriction system-associated AAA family ATPase [Flavobacterium aquicola]|uniref:Restriction system-associated AAA family ATPase n=1 Tax=Flavobacterium aquicola TaxID=1682742 RepID=A0A3E0ETJ7_9FLAO|nr:restriction system-associated AAA family ATPase [Flavobacterium aquicola]REH00991.1 restriction system-associated AAA family ATPase [Flavobacterium aquicola]